MRGSLAAVGAAHGGKGGGCAVATLQWTFVQRLDFCVGRDEMRAPVYIEWRQATGVARVALLLLRAQR
jgi:hypothetical protein